MSTKSAVIGHCCILTLYSYPELLVLQVTIPSKETTYWCSLIKGPKLTKKHHITKVSIKSVFLLPNKPFESNGHTTHSHGLARICTHAQRPSLSSSRNLPSCTGRFVGEECVTNHKKGCVRGYCFYGLIECYRTCVKVPARPSRGGYLRELT